MNELYRNLLSKSFSTLKARIALRNQQRAWLISRGHLCMNADISCLQRLYKIRIDQLQALTAASYVGGVLLDDVIPVMITGTWKATRIYDPGGTHPVDETGLRESLTEAKLPMVEETVRSSPGKLCLPSVSCEQMGWLKDPLRKVDIGSSVGLTFKLDPKSEVFSGSNGSKYSTYLLIPRPDGTLWAVFGLCNHSSGDCREAAEVWTAASADAAISPTPKFPLPAK